MKNALIWLMIFSFTFVALPHIVHAEEGTRISLPAPAKEGGKPLMQVLNERKTSRAFAPTALPLSVLSNLLWASSGINRAEEGKLTAPTAANWQEIDVYVSLEKGLYRYNRQDHALDLVIAEDIRALTGVQDFTDTAPVNLIFVADYAKMSAEENDRTFYAATDTGFISQNVYLFCASEGLATVVIGWVDKSALAKAMRLRENQAVILTQTVGYPAE